MSIVTSFAGGVKTCVSCRGIGRLGKGVARCPCPDCGGKGRCVVRPKVQEYIATVGTDVIDQGGPLDAFMGDLRSTFDLVDEDIAVWKVGEGKPRLVAVLTPGAWGDTEVIWV